MEMNEKANVNEPLAFALDHERLEVYQVAVELHAVACSLLPSKGFRVLRDQLERASLGVVLNIAEGTGRTSPGDKRRFYEMARGSAAETAAAIQVLRIRRLADPRPLGAARVLAVRTVQMLSRVMRRPCSTRRSVNESRQAATAGGSADEPRQRLYPRWRRMSCGAGCADEEK